MDEDLPWFPFYVRDFVRSRLVRSSPPEHIGIYVLLLCEQWENGPLPHDTADMARLVGVDADAMANAWQSLCARFAETEAGWVNERLMEVREEQERKHRVRSRAGKAGARARWSQGKDGDRMANAKRSQSDGNGIKSKNKKKKVDSPSSVTDVTSSGSPTTTTTLSECDDSDEHDELTMLPPSAENGDLPPKWCPDSWRVFEYWRRARAEAIDKQGGPRMQPADFRRSKIQARLREGYEPDTLCRAVDGCLRSKRNVDGGHTDIELICRDQKHVEQYLAWSENGGPPGEGTPRKSGPQYVDRSAVR